MSGFTVLANSGASRDYTALAVNHDCNCRIFYMGRPLLIVTLLILFVFREGTFFVFKTSTILHLGTGVDKVVGTIRFVLGMVVMRYQFLIKHMSKMYVYWHIIKTTKHITLKNKTSFCFKYHGGYAPHMYG